MPHSPRYQIGGGAKPILIRADGAGYSPPLISALSAQGLEFSVGYSVDQAVRDAIRAVPAWTWKVGLRDDHGPNDQVGKRSSARHFCLEDIDAGCGCQAASVRSSDARWPVYGAAVQPLLGPVLPVAGSRSRSG